ncbi:hypothetical protein [Arcobacter sp.]|uniref:hypothetical protein n=1 Tax=Arcobacter sp. TaxID=1872629 RepID=UPI003D11FDBF
MIHQPLKNKQGGTIGVIDYMINNRLKEGTARVLRGNSFLTKELVKQIKFKQKLFVTVLSFEEENIKEDYKSVIMNSYEGMLLPSLEERYNILWVEHTDKNRLELNCMIVKIDLLTHLSLNPYFDKVDRYRVELWRDRQNISYNFSSSNDPSKEQNLNNDKRVNFFSDYKKLNEQLHEHVYSLQIKSRVHLIELLNNNNIEVTKISKNFIEVKLPQSKKSQRLKKGIYSEEFRSIRSIERICHEARKRIDKFNNSDSSTELKYIREKLVEATSRKANFFRKKYVDSKKGDSRRISNSISLYKSKTREKTGTIQPEHGKGVDSNKRKSNEEVRRENVFIKDFYSDYDIFYNGNIYGNSNVHYPRSSVQKLNTYEMLLSKNKGINNDSIGTTIIRRIEEERTTKQESLRKTRESGKFLYSKVIACHKQIHSNHRKDKKGLPASDYTIDERAKEAYRRRRSDARQRQIVLGAIKDITTAIAKYREQLEEYESKIEQFTRDTVKLGAQLQEIYNLSERPVQEFEMKFCDELVFSNIIR